MIKILKNICLSLIIISASSICRSQNWPKVFGDNLQALGYDIKEDYDNGFLIGGATLKNSSQFKFGFLIKTDINGNQLWDKKFGNYQVENFFTDFDTTDDHGLILCGATDQEDYARDPLFVKLNPCGEIEWCKIFLSVEMNYATGVIQLPDGQFLGMLTYYGGDSQHIRISLVKMDVSGEPIWIKHLAQQDTVANEEGRYLDLTPDGNYLVSGSCFSPSLKPYFIKTDTAGEELWNLKWPVGAGGFAGRSAFAPKGVIYNASHLKFFLNLPKVPYLLKLNNSGEFIDQYPLMGDTIYNGGAVSLLLYNDTTIFVGTTWIKSPSSFDGYCDILKIDTMGNHYMQRRLLDEEYPPSCIIRTYDGKIVVIGYFYVDTNWDIYMWKMNENLEDDTLYTQSFVYDSLCPYEIQSDTVLLDCGLFVNIDEIPTQEKYESTIKISPNPARDWIVLTLPDVLAEGKVELSVYDVFGRKAGKQGSREAGRHGGGGAGERGSGEEGKRGSVLPSNRIIFLDVSTYSSGMYIAVVKDQKGRRYTGKFVVGR
jgi:hypothetical protein